MTKHKTLLLIVGFILAFGIWHLPPAFAVAEGTGLNFDIPAPPKSKFLDSKEFRLANRQIYSLLYSSDESLEQVGEYYRDFFQQHEFQKLIDKMNEKIKKQLLRFKKDELVINIAILVKNDSTRVIIAKYLEPAGEPPIEKAKPSLKDLLFTLPKEDMPGEDLSVVPRPPQSVRLMSMVRGSTATLMYTTALDVAAATDFYRAQMPGQEWTLANEIAAKKAVEAYEKATGKSTLGIKLPFSDGEDFEQIISDSYVLNFEAGFGSAQITIFPNFIDRKLGSMVQIVYSEKS